MDLKESPEGIQPGLSFGGLLKGQVLVAQNQKTSICDMNAFAEKDPPHIPIQYASEMKQVKNISYCSVQTVASLTCRESICDKGKVLYIFFFFRVCVCGHLNLIFTYDH